MGRTASRRDRWATPLLILWFAAGSAAASTPHEVAWRDAREAIERAQYQRADERVADALEKYPTGSDVWFWELRILRGETLCWNRQYAAAVEALRFDLPAPLRGSATEVRHLVATGVARVFRGDATGASLLEAARRMSKRHPETEPQVYAWSGIVAQSNPQIAEEYARKATTLAHQRGDRFIEIFAMNQIAFYCAGQQRYGEAIHWWETLLPIVQKHGLTWWIQKTEGNLGWMYLELGDYELAVELFERAQQAAARVEAPGDRIAWTNQRGNVALQTREYAIAEKFCSEAVRLAQWRPTKELGHTLANLARIAIETGRAATAQCRNDAALAVKILVKDHAGVLRSHILNAQIASMRNDHASALRILERIAGTAKQASVRWEAQGRMAQVLVRTGRGADAEAQFRKAIDTVRAARESIDNRDLRFAFFRVAEDVFDAYVDFLVARGRADDALDVTERIRAQSLQEGLGIAAAKTRVDPRVLARERGATILCYWLGREKSYVWVVTPGAVVLKTLPRDRDIETLIDAYRRATLNPHVRLAQTREMGEQLYTMLVAPAGAIARGSRVIVVPDGRMHVLNMESLVVPGTDMRFWIQDVTLVSASSLQLLGRDTAQRPQGGAMLLVGNPPAADAAYPPLTKAKLEIEKVQRHFTKRVVLDGPRATPSQFRASAPGTFDYLHFVAHGEATRRRPLDAAVILGKDASGAYKLFARDIVDQRLAARLVTVSSCHGAGTRAFVGEGLVGLAWAFQRAGARQVVAALWEVDDVATPDLMDAMYTYITAGDDPASALRKAKLRLVESKGIYRKPAYWAPFVVYGG